MNLAPANDREVFVENLAAELTNAVYPIVLRHGIGIEWLDLQLDLWKALSETIKKLEHSGTDCIADRSGSPRLTDFFG